MVTRLTELFGLTWDDLVYSWGIMKDSTLPNVDNKIPHVTRFGSHSSDDLPHFEGIYTFHAI